MAIGFLQWHAVRDMLSTRELVRQSRAVQMTLATLRSALSDAESCQFRYIVTHNEVNVEPYATFLKEADDQIVTLGALISGNASQENFMKQIRPLYAKKRQSMERAMALEKSGADAEALQVLRDEQGGGGMLELEANIDKMQDLQSQILFKWQNIYQHNFKKAAILSVIGMALCFACILAILVLMRRLSSMQSLVTLSALKEMIEYEGGSITIEEYLKRRHDALTTHGQAQIEAERLIGQLEQRKLRHLEK